MKKTLMALIFYPIFQQLYTAFNGNISSLTILHQDYNVRIMSGRVEDSVERVPASRWTHDKEGKLTVYTRGTLAKIWWRNYKQICKFWPIIKGNLIQTTHMGYV